MHVCGFMYDLCIHVYICVLVFCVYVWLTPVGVYNLIAGSCSGLVIWSAASRCDAVWNHLRWSDQSIEWPLSTHTFAQH